MFFSTSSSLPPHRSTSYQPSVPSVLFDLLRLLQLVNPSTLHLLTSNKIPAPSSLLPGKLHHSVIQSFVLTQAEVDRSRSASLSSMLIQAEKDFAASHHTTDQRSGSSSTSRSQLNAYKASTLSPPTRPIPNSLSPHNPAFFYAVFSRTVEG